jgi:hypothetical protein
MIPDDLMTAALDAWRERAAIAEHDGELERRDAETLASMRIDYEFGPRVARAVAKEVARESR